MFRYNRLLAHAANRRATISGTPPRANGHRADARLSWCSTKSRTPGNKTSRSISRVLYGRCLAAPTWRPFLWDAACDASRATNPDGRAGEACFGCPQRAIPIRFCFRWGLPCRRHCWKRGALLPHLFTLTWACPGGSISVALSLGSPPAAVSRHRLSVKPGLSSTPAHPAVRKTGKPLFRRMHAIAAARPTGSIRLGGIGGSVKSFDPRQFFDMIATKNGACA